MLLKTPGTCAVAAERESNKSTCKGQSPKYPNNNEADYELHEIDDEVLITKADTDGDLDEATPFTLIYEMIYSITYGAPVLYFYLDNSAARSPQLANLMDNLVPSVLRTQVHQAGVSGAISQTVSLRQPHCNLVPLFAEPVVQDHPVTNLPVCFVHPCRTHQVMRTVCANQQLSPIIYLLKWIAIFGSVVGLVVPQDLAKSVEESYAYELELLPTKGSACEAHLGNGIGLGD